MGGRPEATGTWPEVKRLDKTVCIKTSNGQPFLCPTLLLYLNEIDLGFLGEEGAGVK